MRVGAGTVQQILTAGRKVRVFSIDVTNHCDGGCAYCVHPTHRRARGFITLNTFAQAIEVASNASISLHHFSEPLLHPQLSQLVLVATMTGKRVGFSTHGKHLTQPMLDNLAGRGLAWLAIHVDVFGVRLRDFRVPQGLRAWEEWVGEGAPDDLQGKPRGRRTMANKRLLGAEPEAGGAATCSYLGKTDGEPWYVVLWDGSLAMCCMDAEGSFDPGLCDNCSGYVFDDPEFAWGDYDGNERGLAQ